MTERLRVGIAGCGFAGRKREQALDGDELVGAYDVDAAAATALDDLDAARYAWGVIEDAYARSAA